MKSIHLHSSFPSFHSLAKHNQQLIKKHKLLNPYSQELTTSTSLVKLDQRILTRIRVITNPLFLAQTSSAQGGDISVLLPTGGVLLFAYGIANFVVPYFISKAFESDKETEDSVPGNDGSFSDEASKEKLQTKK